MAGQRRSGFGRFMLLAIGGAIGAAAGLLFAPKPGKETREQLMTKAEEMMQERERMMSGDIAGKTIEWKGRIDTARERLLTSVDSASQTIKERINQSADMATEKLSAVEEKAEESQAEVETGIEEEKKEETL